MINYKAYHLKKNRLDSWDVLLHHDCLSINPMSRLACVIRNITGSFYNHTSEVLVLDDGIYFIESLRNWVTINKFDEWYERNKYRKKIVVLRYVNQKQFDTKDYIIKALKELDKKYDIIWLSWDMLLYCLFWRRSNKTIEQSKKRRRCSEFNAYMKNINGWDKYMPKDFLYNKDFSAVNMF